MAGKKKASKSAKAKKTTAVSKKKRGRPAKVVKLRAVSAEDAEIEAEFSRRRIELEADIKAFPYVYRVVLVSEANHYCVDSFKNLEAAQDCRDANLQVNNFPWQIIVEKRSPGFGRSGEAFDAW